MTYPSEVLHWIDDQNLPSSSGQTFEKRCPRDGKVVARVTRGGAQDVDRALSLAETAVEGWSRLAPPKRGEILGQAAALIRDRQDELADIVAIETGKPIGDAKAEVLASAALGVFMEGEGSRFYGRTMTSPIANRSVRTVRQPIGICAAITPYNSPMAGVAWKLFPALLCGNAVVAKSHELTPYTAVAFARILREAGLPRGVLSVLQGLGPEVGAALIEDIRVGLVSFTGAVATGKLIQKRVSERPILAKVCLELGGKNPFVVCDDADLEAAATLAVASAFVDAGQRCASGSRIIVARAVYDDFKKLMLEKTEQLQVGSEPSDDMGPLIAQDHLDSLLEAVQGATRRGATLLTGGSRVEADRCAGGYYMAPTVLEDVPPDDEVSQRELFGPVTCLYRVDTFEEALAQANGTSFGLTGAIHTFNNNRIEEFINGYGAGLVSVNGATFGSGPHMPFGGIKNSGNGFREPGTEALDVYSEWKTIVVNHDPRRV